LPRVATISRREAVETTRLSILKSAKAAFLRNGLAGTTMEAVATAAGVSKMTVYRHFISKEELLAEVVRRVSLVDNRLHAAIAGQPLKKGLGIYGRYYASIIFDPETVELNRIVIAEGARVPELSQLYYRNGPQLTIDTLTEFLAPFAEAGRLQIDDPRQAAEEFLDHVRGYAHLRLLMSIGTRPTRAELEEKIDRAMARIVK
jgi:TetR/AcrR family transcriptional regulator, mexJK operon transcriptional repressor